MAFKFTAFLALASAVNAGILPAAQVYHTAPADHILHAAPAYLKTSVAVAQPILTKHDNEYDPHPQYNFAYDIQDELSGDSKSQVESRDGDVVRGQYSLIDADGYKRTVDYSADPIHGFNAVVNRQPLVTKSAAPAIVKSVPIAYAAAPAIYKTAAPLSIAHH